MIKYATESGKDPIVFSLYPCSCDSLRVSRIVKFTHSKPCSLKIIEDAFSHPPTRCCHSLKLLYPPPPPQDKNVPVCLFTTYADKRNVPVYTDTRSLIFLAILHRIICLAAASHSHAILPPPVPQYPIPAVPRTRKLILYVSWVGRDLRTLAKMMVETPPGLDVCRCSPSESFLQQHAPRVFIQSPHRESTPYLHRNL